MLFPFFKLFFLASELFEYIHSPTYIGISLLDLAVQTKMIFIYVFALWATVSHLNLSSAPLCSRAHFESCLAMLFACNTPLCANLDWVQDAYQRELRIGISGLFARIPFPAWHVLPRMD